MTTYQHARAGIAFLLARQGADGLWRDFRTRAGEGVDWPTGFIALQLAEAGAPRAPLERAALALSDSQHDDGGWGYHADVPTDADSTACGLLFLAALGHRDATAERAADCLLRHQDPESGGIPTYRKPRPIRRFMGLSRRVDLRGWCSAHLEVTASAGRAFATAQDGLQHAALAAWRYVGLRQREDGCWHSYWWVSPHYPTLQAVALACTVGNRQAAQRAAAWTQREQRDDGGWGDPVSAFATALSLRVLTLAGERGAAIERAVARLTALQDADGGWPSAAEMRIPPPAVAEPDDYRNWRSDRLGTGVTTRDQHRLFTTAACVAALTHSGGRE